MTRDDVMRLEGRELDAAVAELVFGRRVVECDPVDGRYGPYTVREGHWTRVNGETYPLLDLLPEYSTDIAAAWEVVTHLQGDGYTVQVELHHTGRAFCRVIRPGEPMVDRPTETWDAERKTVADSICRAALLAAQKRSCGKKGGEGR